MVILTRFRDLPDDEMKLIADYVDSGRPIVGLRTATHAFNLKSGSAYAHYSWTSKVWDGGFGRQVLGETWIDHHGRHGKQSTRGIIAPGGAGASDSEGHPGRRHLGPDRCLQGPPAAARRQQAAGSRTGSRRNELHRQTCLRPAERTDDARRLGQDIHGQVGQSRAIFTTTMGASQDLLSEGTRRMLVNACYWAIGLEDKIPGKSDVMIVGEYTPLPFGFGAHKKGVRPSELAGD